MTLPTPLGTANIVFLTGNSQMSGGNAEYLHYDFNAEAGKFPTHDPLTANRPGRTTDPRKQTWNDDTRRWEVMQHNRNGAGWGASSPPGFGPEISLSSALLQRGIDNVFVIKCSQPGAPVSGANGTAGVFNEPTARVPFDVTASMTVAPISDAAGATFTAAAGTFVAASVGDGVLIEGSAGYLTQIGIVFPGPLPDGGNNTYIAKPLFITAKNGDHSQITVGREAGGGVWFRFTAETATLTLTIGQLNLRPLVEATVARALFQLRRDLRLDPVLALSVCQFGEADINLSQAAFHDLMVEQASWIRGMFGWDGTEEQCPPHGFIKLGTHGYTMEAFPQGCLDIRAAQEAAAAAITNGFAVETNDLPTRWEPTSGDSGWPPTSRADNGLHLTPSAIVEIGWRVDLELDAFAWIPERQAAADLINPAGGSYYGLVAVVEPEPGEEEQIILPATPADIIRAIDEAMAAGAEVAAYTVNGRVVQLRGFDELLRARRYFEGLIVRTSGIRRTRVQF